MAYLNIEIETITPMYVGGAGQKAELRAPSIKGLLRYWYRTIDPMHNTREGMFFGDADKNGMSPISVYISKRPNPERLCYIKKKPDESKAQACTTSRDLGLAYLTFPFGMQGGIRDALAAGQTYRIENVIRNLDESKNAKQIHRALCSAWFLLSTIGGIGSRSRRGFGSFQIKEIESDLKYAALLQVINRQSTPNAWWTVFQKSMNTILKFSDRTHCDRHLTLSSGTRFALIGKPPKSNRGFQSWETALSYFGQELREYRANISYEAKAAFGLPIEGKAGKNKISIKGKHHSRGSSPLLCSTIRIGSEYFLLIAETNSPVVAKDESVIFQRDRDETILQMKRKELSRFFDLLVKRTSWRLEL